jgi:type III restriction enzyme
VDTLTVIAHDRFDDVIRKAREADSLVKVREIRIGEHGDVPAGGSHVVVVPPSFEMELTGRPAEGIEDIPADRGEGKETPSIFDNPENQDIAKVAIDLVAKKYERKLPGGVKDLTRPEVQAEIIADIERIREAAEPQGSLDGIVAKPDLKKIVGEVAASIAANTIEIPEIVVLPSREVNFWFEDFDLTGLSAIRLQPISDQIRIRNLRNETYRDLARSIGGAREMRMENYIVKHLIDKNQIDYDTQADLLYKLSGQMIAHLRTYLTDEEAVENVALAHGRTLADFIFEQMMRHYRETPTEYRAQMVRVFRVLQPQMFAISSIAKRLLITQSANPLAETLQYLFYGTQKSPYQHHKFDSDAERRFAALIDNAAETSVLRWLKPAARQFQIEYRAGKAYEPDFVVETWSEKIIVEVKADRDMKDPVVEEKARAGRKWAQHATELARQTGGKPWGYALVADSDITENASFAGLMARSRQDLMLEAG